MRLEDHLYLQRDQESSPCCEILYIRCTHIMRVVLYVNPLDYLSTFCFQYFLHLFKSFSLLITSTTRVQIQSNLGTTGYSGHTAFTFVKQRCLFRLRRKTIPLYLKLRLRQFVLGFGSVSLLRRLYSLLRSLIFINFSLRLGADCSLRISLFTQ